MLQISTVPETDEGPSSSSALVYQRLAEAPRGPIASPESKNSNCAKCGDGVICCCLVSLATVGTAAVLVSPAAIFAAITYFGYGWNINSSIIMGCFIELGVLGCLHEIGCLRPAPPPYRAHRAGDYVELDDLADNEHDVGPSEDDEVIPVALPVAEPVEDVEPVKGLASNLPDISDTNTTRFSINR